MKLFTRRHGDGENALIILPGLLGSSANWQSIAKRMARERSVYVLDMRNHGQSPWSNTMNYFAMADDVGEFISGLPHEHISLMGHSMGGKAAMRLAFNDPQLVDALIVADVAPVPYVHDFSDLIEPMLGLNLSQLKNRAHADTLMQTSVDNPGIRAFLLHNLAFDPSLDAYHWRPNLEVLLANMPSITGFELGSHDTFDKACLFIYGGSSDYVTPDKRQIIRAHFNQAAFVELENAGHWLHAEQPLAYIKACEAFLSQDY